MQKKEPLKELPPKYYLDNFRSVLHFVEEMYGGLLQQNELDFISAFRTLSEDAQCLFLRFANRRGLFFRTDKLVYSEIINLEEALNELLFRNFVERPCLQHKLLASHFLQIYSKQELLLLCREQKLNIKGMGKLKKPELADLLLRETAWEDLVKATVVLGPSIKHNYEQELELLKFLFFGYLGGDMAEFVIRDLGMVRYESPEQDKLVPRFSNRQEVEELLYLSQTYACFRELREQDCPETLYSWYTGLCSGISVKSEAAMALWSRLTLKLARILERHQQYDRALEVYGQTEKAPSRERRVRLLHKAGAVQAASVLCRQMQKNPQNADELYFARDFKERLYKKKAKKSTTLYLKEADEIRISAEYKYQVERGVICYYTDKGMEAYHSENFLWRSLFGLIFWDIIFDHEAPVYHSPLQRTPSDLYLSGFFDARQEQLQLRMLQLAKKTDLIQHVEKVYEEKWGMGNSFVGWHDDTLPLVRAACEKLEIPQLWKVLLEMGRNLKENGRGFPDLFIWTQNDYLFAEVKSPTDSLSAQQLFWLRFFDKCGIKAKVIKVEWEERKFENRN